MKEKLTLGFVAILLGFALPGSAQANQYNQALNFGEQASPCTEAFEDYYFVIESCAWEGRLCSYVEAALERKIRLCDMG